MTTRGTLKREQNSLRSNDLTPSATDPTPDATSPRLGAFFGAGAPVLDGAFLAVAFFAVADDEDFAFETTFAG